MSEPITDAKLEEIESMFDEWHWDQEENCPGCVIEGLVYWVRQLKADRDRAIAAWNDGYQAQRSGLPYGVPRDVESESCEETKSHDDWRCGWECAAFNGLNEEVHRLRNESPADAELEDLQQADNATLRKLCEQFARTARDLRKERQLLRLALTKVTQPSGAWSNDPILYRDNVIAAMTEVAREALA